MAYLTTWAEDINPATLNFTGDKLKLIKYHSTAKVTMELNDAVLNLDACVIVNGKNKVYDTSAKFNNVESESFRFSCEDSEGKTYTAVHSLQMIEYVKPTCNIAHSTIDGDGNVTIVCYGNFFNESFGEWDNEMIVKCRYTDATGGGGYSDWKQMRVTIYPDGGYTANIDFGDLEYKHVYLFEVQIQDLLETKTATRIISSVPLFHWGKDDFTFEVPVNAKDIRLKSSGSNYGHYLRFGDGNYCYIAELTDDVMTIRAKEIIFNTDNGTGSLSFGTWTPSLDSDAVQYWENCQQGWYSKVGNTVTVGFYIKAECYSGYTDTPIVIEGLPFTPMYDSAGGGMCSGAYVSGGYNFQCFVAETDGTITTRVQKCNNTSATNLGTSASGCNYSSDGGDVTLSGTITYLTNV